MDYDRSCYVVRVGSRDSSVSDIFAIELGSELDSEIDICPNLHSVQTKVVYEILQEDYFDTANTPAIEHNYEMKMRLKSDTLISFSSRRLSYKDKQNVSDIIEKLLCENKIRPRLTLCLPDCISYEKVGRNSEIR